MLQLRKILSLVTTQVLTLSLPAIGIAAGGIENPAPGSMQSGIGLISGWYCPAATLTFGIDGGAQQPMPSGGARGDTASVCGGATNTGFGLLINFNNLTPGTHTVRLYANGSEVDAKTFGTTNLGGEFMTGKTGQYFLNNFPGPGQRTQVQWQQEKQNFSIVGSDHNFPSLIGTYYGASVYTATGCGARNGNYAEGAIYTVTQAGASATVRAQFLAGGSCTFTGTLYYYYAGGNLNIPSGSFSCSDGTSGSFTAPDIVLADSGVVLDFTQTFTSGCRLQGRLGGPRA